MSSGIRIDDQVKLQFDALKLQHKYRWLLLKITNDCIVVDTSMPTSVANSEQSYREFTQAMPTDEGRYGIFDLEYTLGTDGVRSKLVLVSWSPDTSSVRERMLYAASKQALCRTLDGIVQVQATDSAELSYECILAQVAPKSVQMKREE